MIITKRLVGKAIATWLGPTGDAARRAVRRFTDPARRLDLYFDIADPHSYLAAQIAKRLVAAYGVELGFTVVTPPASDVDSHPAMREKHSVRDAQALAEFYDLDFPGKREADPGAVRDVGTSLVRERPALEQLDAALEFGAALWANDRKQITKLLGKYGAEAHGAVSPILNAAYAELRKAGHYKAGMFHFAGEWYSIDRIAYLERALGEEKHVVRERTDRAPRPLSDKPLVCDMWISFRSPYSYLALEQIDPVLGDVPLALHPVLPLVARGAQMPRTKLMYIMRDAKREADRLAIPFGEMCDPLGDGVANCIAIAYWAEQRGRLAPFVRSAMRAIWSEARDMAEYVDLRYVVERAELPWAEAREQLGKPEATKWANGNAADLAVIGLWGVPSFRIGDFVTWGQDRIPLLVDRLRRHEIAREAVSAT